jgi:hypothetical protein
LPLKSLICGREMRGNVTQDVIEVVERFVGIPNREGNLWCRLRRKAALPQRHRGTEIEKYPYFIETSFSVPLCLCGKAFFL